jgi:hypothetical protein
MAAAAPPHTSANSDARTDAGVRLNAGGQLRNEGVLAGTLRGWRGRHS